MVREIVALFDRLGSLKADDFNSAFSKERIRSLKDSGNTIASDARQCSQHGKRGRLCGRHQMPAREAVAASSTFDETMNQGIREIVVWRHSINLCHVALSFGPFGNRRYVRQLRQRNPLINQSAQPF